MIYAAFLFFRVDRRPHTFWYLVRTPLGAVGFKATSNRLVSFTAMAVPVGINLIAQALITYSFITIALIQWRKHSAPKFGEER